MACSIAEFVDAMNRQGQQDVRQLREFSKIPTLSGNARHAILDLLHAEQLRLDMLRSAIAKLQAAAV